MFKEGKVGTYEMVSLIVITLISPIFYISPSQLNKLIGNAAWMEVIVSSITAIIAFTFIYLLMKRYPNNNFVEVLQNVFGSVIGKSFLMCIVIYFIFDTAITLREFTDILKSLVLPLTPISIIFISLLITIVTLSYLGLEAQARTTAFFSIWMLIVFMLIIFLPAGNFKTYRLFPLFGYGLDKIFYYGIQRSSAWGKVLFLAFVMNSLQGIKHFKKIGYMSLIIMSLLVVISFINYISVFPYYAGSEPVSGFLQMSRTINYGRFFQRLEAIFIFLWVLTTLIALSFTFYITTITFAKTFRLTDYKPLLIPFAVLTFTIAILPSNFSLIATKAVLLLRTYAWIPTYGVTILALIVAIIRKKKGKLKHE